MKTAALLGLLLLQAAPGEPPAAQPAHMRYRRAITVPSGSGQACVALDAQVFPHAEPALKDLRIFASSASNEDGTPHEVPFVITLSEAVSEETQPAQVLNLGTGPGSAIVFDLQMPDRPYTDVTLDLNGHDFLATATVAGMDAPGSARRTALGSYTLFDLSAQRLSRDTTLPLPESTFRTLHITLAVSPAPGSSHEVSFSAAMVAGAHVPPSREAETLYTTIASASKPAPGTAAGPRRTRFEFALPRLVPVERVSIDLDPAYTGNFSRDVAVHASAERPTSPEQPNSPEQPAPATASRLPEETVFGIISRVRSTEAGRRIDEAQLSVPATLGSNLQAPAKVWVDIENGDDQPLPIAAIRLEMRQRKLCFDAPLASGSTLLLEYGDPTLLAPVYDYARLFTPARHPLQATLAPEELNPAYHPPPAQERPFTERHPEVLWIALIAVVCVLGAVALRSARRIHPR